MSAIPPAFFPVLKQFAEFSRKKVKINMLNKSTAINGELTQIRLLEGKLDMSTFSIGGKFTTATTAGYATIGHINHAIEQILVEVGSVQLHPSFNYYNQVWDIMNTYTGGWTKSGVNGILHLQNTASTVAANMSAVPFQLSQFLGALNDFKILPTDRLPPVTISIRWAQPNVLACSTGTTGAAFAITDLYVLVDALKLSPVYDNLVSDHLAQSPLQMPYNNFQVIPCQQGGLTATNRFSSTADSLERAYVTYIPTTYQNQNQAIDTTTLSSAVFTHGSPNLINGYSGRFTVNGFSFPDMASYNERGEVLKSTLETLNEDKDVTSLIHPNLNTLGRFSTNFFVHGVNFSWNDVDSDVRKCGISALGQNLQGSYESFGNGQSDQVQPLIILQTKSVLEVGPARSVRVIY